MFKVLLSSRTIFHRQANVFELCPKFYGDANHSKVKALSQIKQCSYHAKNNNIHSRAEEEVRLAENTLTLMQRLVHYVERTTYMDEVRTAQAHVMEIKRKLLTSGEEKRTLMRKLEDIRNDLNHIYKDMKINRTKETYIDLARKEIELCELEKQFSDMYKQFDKQEQLLFTEFAAAINVSYEKEKLHTNFIKVISIIGTVASSFIALIFSIFIHSYQQRAFLNQRSLDDSVINTVKTLENNISQLLIEWNNNKNKMHDDRREVKESWGSYLNRHTRWVYSWAIKSS